MDLFFALLIPVGIFAAFIWAIKTLKAKPVPEPKVPPLSDAEREAQRLHAQEWVDRNLSAQARRDKVRVKVHKPNRTAPAVAGGMIGRQEPRKPVPAQAVEEQKPSPATSDDDGFVAGVVTGITLDTLFSRHDDSGSAPSIETDDRPLITSDDGGDFGGGGASGSWDDSTSSFTPTSDD